MLNLSTLKQLPRSIQRPHQGFTRAGTGIVHLGPGAFHRAHQAVYTDSAMAASGGNWRIATVNMRTSSQAQKLMAQDGLYTLLMKDSEHIDYRVIGSIATACALQPDREKVMALLTAESTRIVSLTVTEKAYCLNPVSRTLDRHHSDIVADLADADQPRSIPGLLVQALAERHRLQRAPFTVLSCDNLPMNGSLTQKTVLEYAQLAAQDIVDWIAEKVAFPNTVVDRITPAITTAELSAIASATGQQDTMAVQCESFSQWIIEDNFPSGRPDWSAAGATFTSNITPFERMKLRMLNGSHSLIAYVGVGAGLSRVRDAVSVPQIAQLVRRHMSAAASTLETLKELDYADYSNSLIKRFANPNIQHFCIQIAQDGSQKMMQRMFEPATELLQSHGSITTFAFATAAWIRHCTGISERGQKYNLDDPRSHQITNALKQQTGTRDMYRAITRIDGLFPQALLQSDIWNEAVQKQLSNIQRKGLAGAIETLLSDEE